MTAVGTSRPLSIAVGFRLWLTIGVLLIWTGSLSLTICRGRGAASTGSWCIGVLPAARGRLLDHEGVPLAWSERQFCLMYRRPEAIEILWRDLYAAESVLHLPAARLSERVANDPAAVVEIRRGLSAAELLALAPLLRANPRFTVASCFVRRHFAGEPAVVRQLGATRQIGTRELGITGWEARHNGRLLGRDGRYRVKIDARGEWLLETWEELQPPRSGYDVYLPFTVEPRAAQLDR